MKINHTINDIIIQFDKDDAHPWPYYEGLSGPDGMYFSFLIPDHVSNEEIKNYKRVLRNKRDVTGITIYRYKGEL